MVSSHLRGHCMGMMYRQLCRVDTPTHKDLQTKRKTVQSKIKNGACKFAERNQKNS